MICVSFAWLTTISGVKIEHKLLIINTFLNQLRNNTKKTILYNLQITSMLENYGMEQNKNIYEKIINNSCVM